VILDKIYTGDNLAMMRTWPGAFVQTCVTSPPYFGLRDYGHEEQIGRESSLMDFVMRLTGVFREVKRVLRDDGTLWLNLGDSYNHYDGNRGPGTNLDKSRPEARPNRPKGYGISEKSAKYKDLLGVPWAVAFALREDGWYLRDEIIWNKPNPMPSSTRDRCTRAHEHIFMFAKRARKYYYDQAAIRTPLKVASVKRLAQNVDMQKGSDRVPGKTNGAMKAVCFGGSKGSNEGAESYTGRTKTGRERASGENPGANKKSVWTVTTKPFKEKHFATFPPDLIEPCVLAGSPRGGVVLDPFMGAGTTGLVAARHGRRYIGCELNPEYVAIAEKRIEGEQNLVLDKIVDLL
jgi:DNA modification methylase